MPVKPSQASGALLPGTPTAGVLCHYTLATPNDFTSGHLTDRVELTGDTLSGLLATVHALVPSNKVASCPPPMIVDVLTFDYPGAPAISLQVSCAMVWQDDSVHAMLADPFASKLQALLAPASTQSASPVVSPSPARSTALSTEPASPDALAIAPDGTLYIADELLNVLFARSPSGAFRIAAGTGISGYSGDGGPATSAELNSPSGMVVEPDGTLLIADTANNRVRAVSPDGVIATVAGNGQGGANDVLARALQATLDQPRDVNLDGHGNVLIATGTHILRMNASGALTVVAGGTPGGVIGIGGPASAGSADFPDGVAVGGNGGTYISGFATKALLYVTPGGTLSLIGSGLDFYARGFGGLRTASDGSVVGINSQQVLRYHGTTPSLVYDFGATPFFGDVHGFIPNGLAVSASGDIYVDTDGNSGWADRPAIVRIDVHGQPTIIWEGPPTTGEPYSSQSPAPSR
jgi:sugar lactone lactonase YvrE